MRIAAVEPYAALSHRQFLVELRRHSRHEIEVFTLPARAWKWRMRTASIHFAQVLEPLAPFDILFVSDYLNLPELHSLLPEPHRETPVIVYMHENQLTYPLRAGEVRDHHFALTHLHSMLTAQRTVFNSHFHHDAFFPALTELLALVPDVDMEPALEIARSRASVLHLGTDLPAGVPRTPRDGVPTILWNHRWEYDKDPEVLRETMDALVRNGERFRLRLLGQEFREEPAALGVLRAELGDVLEHVGFLRDRADYHDALSSADVVLSTARHEFFGLATLEALRAGCLGVLPDDLAYPELLPEDEAVRERFLYRRADGPLETLRRALRAVREGEWRREREAAIRHTDRFTWDVLAPEFDRLFEDTA